MPSCTYTGVFVWQVYLYTPSSRSSHHWFHLVIISYLKNHFFRDSILNLPHLSHLPPLILTLSLFIPFSCLTFFTEPCLAGSQLCAQHLHQAAQSKFSVKYLLHEIIKQSVKDIIGVLDTVWLNLEIQGSFWKWVFCDALEFDIQGHIHKLILKLLVEA